ncbi:MAG: marine proteobacterial sortase target protein [Pseudomonadota bacterium]
MQHNLHRRKTPLTPTLFSMLCLLCQAVSAAPGSLTLRLANDGSDVDAVRLTTRLDITVSGHVARTVVTQSFRNATNDWAEAIYNFPLPERAAVDHLTLKIGERLILGEIQPRERALQVYNEAKAAGKKTALLEQQRANFFTTGVANIAPGETVEIEIEYQQIVDRDGLRYALRVPLTMTPRYLPGSPQEVIQAQDRLGSRWFGATDQVTDGNALLISQTAEVAADSHRLQLFASIDAGMPLALIQSRYHRVDVSPVGGHLYSVQLSDETVLDHDFELEWQADAGTAPSIAAFAHESQTARYAAVQIMPPESGSTYTPPRALTLVIDTSGSMQGVSIEQARSAAIFAIQGLRDIDHFNVIEFNSSASRLFSAPVAATSEHRDRAVRWIRQLQANGGTEMASALDMAIDQQGVTSGELKQIIFVTDGAVGNESALYQKIESTLGDTRLFTVGIGSAPNSWFMHKAAEVGRGSVTMISALNEVDARMQALFNRLAQPVLTSISVDWGGATVEQYPQTVPDLYAGEPVDLSVRTHDLDAPLRGTIRGTWWDQGEAKSWAQQIDLSQLETPAYPGVGVLWARAKIDTLEVQHRRGLVDADATDSAITAVALSHHLVSRLTSLVAVDHTPARVQEALLQRRVPNLAPHGQNVHAMQSITATATPAQWRLITGVALVWLAWLLRVMRWPAMPATWHARRNWQDVR